MKNRPIGQRWTTTLAHGNKTVVAGGKIGGMMNHVLTTMLGASLLMCWPSWAWAYQGMMKYTAFACVTQETYVRTQKMAHQGDWEAVARMLAGRQCTRIERGQAVEVEDVTWGGLVQVRLRGRTQE